MNLKSLFLTGALALGLLFPPMAGATQETIKSTTDETGKIQIRTPSPADKEKEKAGEKGEQGAEEKAQPEKEVKKQYPPREEAPPGLYPPTSRRPQGPAAEARRKAFEKAHPNLVKPPGETPQETPALPEGQTPAAPVAPQGQPERPPAP
jgi:hypothetical protein